MKLSKDNKGITLVALVITIIILLILAGITIASLTSTGLFAAAQDAKTKTEEKQLEENTTLNEYEDAITEQVTGKKPEKPFKGTTVAQAIEYKKVLNANDKTELTDANGNKIVIPAGFKIVSNADTNNAKTVDQGIVIEDATTNEDGTVTATNGSQFVWVPVGFIKKADATTTSIVLNRYDLSYGGFESGSTIKIGGCSCVEASTWGNTAAKDINGFIKSVGTNGGYYIGRYEARYNSDGATTTKKEDKVWRNITQPTAAEKTRSMYKDKDAGGTFTCDLINSYVWDTTTIFIKNFGTNAEYYNSSSKNTVFAENGTNDDIQCNIFDMASNVSEYTTEGVRDPSRPCVYRGSNYYYKKNNYYKIMYDRDWIESQEEYGKRDYIGFRSVLYL